MRPDRLEVLCFADSFLEQAGGVGMDADELAAQFNSSRGADLSASLLDDWFREEPNKYARHAEGYRRRWILRKYFEPGIPATDIAEIERRKADGSG